MTDLRTMKCVACRGGEPTVSEEEVKEYKPQVPDWEIVERVGINRLERQYKFRNFREALTFTNKVGELAEEQDHHPLIQTEWGRVTVTWWTHAIKGLHRNDFVMAAKTDELYNS